MIYENILDLIGNTPLIRLHLDDAQGNQVYAKLEMYNPTGSLKDRSALYMIEAAEKRGQLISGSTIIESTSGNLGVSLAFVGQQKGYKVICVVDPKAPPQSVLHMKALGAKIVVVDTKDEFGGYQKNRIRKVAELHKVIPDSFVPNQYSNSDNPLSFQKVAEEIIDDLGHDIDFLVCSVSTGGHISGLAQVLKKKIPGIKVVGVEPEGSIVFGGEKKPYFQNGIGLSFVPEVISFEHIDQHFKVPDNRAFELTRKLIKDEGLLVGISSGSVIYGVLQLIKQYKNKKIISLLPDNGGKYVDQLF